MAGHSFLCSFSKFLRYFTKILCINTSISKIIVPDLNVLPLGYTSATLRYIRPSLPRYDFIWLTCPFSEIINRKRRHIGIRIIIRLIYYPINGYPDSKLSVLSIPNVNKSNDSIEIYSTL